MRSEASSVGVNNGDNGAKNARASFCNASYTLGDPATTMTTENHDKAMTDELSDILLKDFKVGDRCTSSKSRYQSTSQQEVRVDGFKEDKVLVTFLTGPKTGKTHLFKKENLELKHRPDAHAAGIPSGAAAPVPVTRTESPAEIAQRFFGTSSFLEGEE